jgi:hypothetical protein
MTGGHHHAAAPAATMPAVLSNGLAPLRRELEVGVAKALNGTVTKVFDVAEELYADNAALRRRLAKLEMAWSKVQQLAKADAT